MLVDLVAETRAPAWLSYQCRDGATTAAGEPIADAVALASDARCRRGRGQLHRAADVPALLAAAAAAPPSRSIAYPNGGDTWDAARPPLGRGRRRSVRRRRRSLVDRAWRDLARWLLRDRPDRYRRPGGRYRRVLIRPQ